MDVKRCQAKRKDGHPCAARTLPGEGYCFVHSSTTLEKREAARKAGGKGRSANSRALKLMIQSGHQVDLKDLGALLRGAIDSLARGEIEPSHATAMANLARTAVAIESAIQWQTRLERAEQALMAITDVVLGSGEPT